MTGSEMLLAAAMRQVGAPFRLHGRDPATGLDCVGLVVVCLEAIGRPFAMPLDYGLRWADLPAMSRQAEAAGLVPVAGAIRAGDILLVRPATAQFHLLIAAPDGGAIHAHAGLRRVVNAPLPPDWPVAMHWRLIA